VDKWVLKDTQNKHECIFRIIISNSGIQKLELLIPVLLTVSTGTLQLPSLNGAEGWPRKANKSIVWSLLL